MNTRHFLPENIHDNMDELISEFEAYLEDFIAGMVRGFTKIVDMIVIITVIPVLVFYFLKDFDTIKTMSRNGFRQNTMSAQVPYVTRLMKGLAIISGDSWLFVCLSVWRPLLFSVYWISRMAYCWQSSWG